MNPTVKNALFVAGLFAAFVAVLFIGKSLGGEPTPGQVQQTQTERAAEAAHTRKELHDAEVWSCKYLYGNVQRVLHAMLAEDLQGAQRARKIKHFPGFSKADLHRIIRLQVAAKRRRMKRVQPVNCVAFWQFLSN